METNDKTLSEQLRNVFAEICVTTKEGKMLDAAYLTDTIYNALIGELNKLPLAEGAARLQGIENTEWEFIFNGKAVKLLKAEDKPLELIKATGRIKPVGYVSDEPITETSKPALTFFPIYIIREELSQQGQLSLSELQSGNKD